jgi:hypothetical protein
MISKELLDQVMALPAAERAALGDELLASVNDWERDGELAEEALDPVMEAWLDEAERRLARIDSGEEKTVPWEDALRRLKAR